MRMISGTLALIVAMSTAMPPGLSFDGGSKDAVPQVNNPKTGHSRNRRLRKWQPGQLDMHHMYVGSSVSTFVILPDSTTILIDAGDLNATRFTQSRLARQIEAIDVFPNDSFTPAGWIVQYLLDFAPASAHRRQPKRKAHQHQLLHIDYLIITHFHADHVGEPEARSKKSPSGTYTLAGVPEVAQHVSFGTLIDRGYPLYDYPKLLRTGGDSTFENYVRWLDQAVREGMHAQRFEVGRDDQITMRHKPSAFPGFRVRNIKRDMSFSRATPDDRSVHTIPGSVLDADREFNENFVSLGMVMHYGDFAYYEGGDQDSRKVNGLLIDTVTPVASAAGRVDVATLNHHGHGMNAALMRDMDPRVMVVQGWAGDHVPTSSMQVIAETTSEQQPRDIFATHIHEKRLRELGQLANLFTSTAGHVVVRVYPPGSQPSDPKVTATQPYEVFVLDANRKVVESRAYTATHKLDA
uniref:Metallo-beta-lactamase domain-containing protein n=2 Tax=Chrysotila carterae TaxID=13221 RepID=A0A7S4EVB2_CHRCT